MLPCQLDATLTTLDTTVLRCDAASAGTHAVVLAETPFYPEGGGQPADHGHIGAARVLDVQTVDGVVVHTTNAPVSGAVAARVDAARRLDHMQQHTAQHLLSAIIEDTLGAGTVGFHLGDNTTTIDLARSLSTAELTGALDRVNAEIRAARAVRAEVVDLDEYAARDVRSRGLPDGFTGDVRLVGIEGLDLNTCGGTHVANTAALQVVQVVRAERYKGGSRVHFVAGERARAAHGRALDREQGMSKALTAGPDDHLPAVSKLLDQAKAGAKARKALLMELGGLLGAEVARTATDDAAHVHRDEADPALLKAIADAALAARPGLRLLLTGGPAAGAGAFLVAGPADAVAAAGPAIATALGGRGGGRGGRFQGKAADLSGAARALAALQG
jgi:misacylated tRNA(Ala) deacylase